jgi:PIF1-like helicase
LFTILYATAYARTVGLYSVLHHQESPLFFSQVVEQLILLSLSQHKTWLTILPVILKRIPDAQTCCNLYVSSFGTKLQCNTGLSPLLLLFKKSVMEYAPFRYAIEAVDRTLQDIWSNQNPFRGITVVFGGDFQQTLPIIPHSTCKDILLATIQRSHLWPHISLLCLKQNMCVENDPTSHSFAQWLLDIGHGNAGAETEQNWPRSVEIPHNMVCRDEDDLIDSIYSSMNDSISSLTPDYFQEHVILAPLNDSVHTLNANVLDCQPGEVCVYNSADCQLVEDGKQLHTQDLPIEFLNSLNASGLPVAHLHLKQGCPMIIL